MESFLFRLGEFVCRFCFPLYWLIFCLYHCFSDEFSFYFWSLTITPEIEFGLLICNVFFCVMYLASQLVKLVIDLIFYFIKRKFSAEADEKK